MNWYFVHLWHMLENIYCDRSCRRLSSQFDNKCSIQKKHVSSFTICYGKMYWYVILLWHILQCIHYYRLCPKLRSHVAKKCNQWWQPVIDDRQKVLTLCDGKMSRQVPQWPTRTPKTEGWHKTLSRQARFLQDANPKTNPNTHDPKPLPLSFFKLTQKVYPHTHINPTMYCLHPQTTGNYVKRNARLHTMSYLWDEK